LCLPLIINRFLLCAYFNGLVVYANIAAVILQQY
jgi:hypothetical protein